MNSRKRLQAALNHIQPDKIPVDIGSTSVTGIHVLALKNLRDYYSLEKRPVRLIEPYQMLGEVENDLADILGLDVTGILARNTMFGYPGEAWKEYRTHWGQELLVPGKFVTLTDDSGDFLTFPEGDTSVPPSGKMPGSGFFFDSIIRQDPIVEEELNPEDNLEDFKVMSEADLLYWRNAINQTKDSGKGVIVNFGGTAIGDIALVPAPFMKHPKGIRDITEWYISTLTRTDLLHTIFEKQTEIALENFRLLQALAGDHIDAVFLCGTDFGTQQSTFCSPQQFEDLYLPYYKKMNDWIHAHTSWKTFKHSCGAVETFMESFIKAGFDIINPVQINAEGMDPRQLKKKYGTRLVFWGGGIDTQKVLPFGTPEAVKKQVLENCVIFSQDGGFVFNTIHNIQANVPVENLVALFDALKEFNG